MVKILGICGSPRKRSAYSALEAALEAAKNSGEEVETELIELRGKKINPCIHCNNCLKKNMDRCTVYEDDMTPLYDKFYEADGILIASPVYEMNITAQTVIFMDGSAPRGLRHQRARSFQKSWRGYYCGRHEERRRGDGDERDQ